MLIAEENDEAAINTSVVSIHTFLSNFLKFYSCNFSHNVDFYKDEFLKMINMPYGFSPKRRLCEIHGH